MMVQGVRFDVRLQGLDHWTTWHPASSCIRIEMCVPAACRLLLARCTRLDVVEATAQIHLEHTDTAVSGWVYWGPNSQPYSSITLGPYLTGHDTA
ncbi:BQ5605_C018g08705 [Microbotryum silenes-dioicae]|uniref:BQ5605_C018g08705 protein n=1 Tax=Microbotryum silenes-dioicae TaxID=796604 RepID=A0A2X0P0B2_9BASI|nr:BQ5605_C018g08705 [Microbotryum silenes-dioicae]